MAKLILHRNVKVDGVEFEAGDYDTANFDQGSIESIVNAGWGTVRNGRAELLDPPADDSPETVPQPKVTPKATPKKK